MGQKVIGFLTTSSILGNVNQIIEGARAYADSIHARLVRFTVVTRFPAERHPRQMDILVNLIKESGISGLLYLGWIEEFEDPETARQLLSRIGDIPVLNVGRSQAFHPCVRLNGGALMEKLLRHALEVHQQRRLLFICPVSHDDRVDAYREFMEKHGLYHRELMICREDFYTADHWYFEQRAHDLYAHIKAHKLLDRACGILSMYRRETSTLIELLKADGIEVPRDLAVYCWEEDERSPYSDPPLTTVHFPFWDMGYAGCHQLDKLIAGRSIPMESFVPGHLIPRLSCGCGHYPDHEPHEHSWLTFDLANFWPRLERSLRQDGGREFQRWVDHWVEHRMVQAEFRADFLEDLMNLQNLCRTRLGQEIDPGVLDHFWIHLVSGVNRHMEHLGGKLQARHNEISRSFADLGQKLLGGYDINRILGQIPENLGGVSLSAWVYLLPDYQQRDYLPQARDYRLEKSLEEGHDTTSQNRSRRWKGCRSTDQAEQAGAMDYLHLLHVGDRLLGFVVFRSAHHDERAFNNLAVQLSSSIQSAFHLRSRRRANKDMEKLLHLSRKLANIRDSLELMQEIPGYIQRRFELEQVRLYICDQAGGPEREFPISPSPAGDEVLAPQNPMGCTLDQIHQELQAMGNKGRHRLSLGNCHGVSLNSQDQVLGYLLLRERPFQDSFGDNSFLGLLAEQISGALLNSSYLEELQSSRLAAELANRAKSQFLASMSHELRTPLNSILGFAQILESNSDLDDEYIEDVRTIRESGEHLLNLINDVLDMAKIESGHLELVIDTLDVRAFLQDLYRMLKIRAFEKKLALKWEIRDDLPDRVMADPRRLRQILLNLLANALKFTETGSVRFAVWPAGVEEGQYLVHFEVSDTGPGIGAKDQKQLFKPFEQFGDHHSRAAGAGLGLAISRELVRSMGGDLQCHSVEGEGSTFWFELPLLPGDAKLALDRKLQSLRPIPVDLAYRILVVDDKRNNRSFIARFLQPLGFQILEAEDGREALDLMSGIQVDAVITDLVMPGLDGFALIQEIRRNPATIEVPILVVSASVFAENSQHALDLGANAFLPKPLDIRHLLDTLAGFLHWDHGSPEGSRSPDDPAPNSRIPQARLLGPTLEELGHGNILGVQKLLSELRLAHPEYLEFWEEAERLAAGFMEVPLKELLKRSSREASHV